MKKLARMFLKRFFQVMDVNEFGTRITNPKLPPVGTMITVVHAPDKKGSDAFAGYTGIVETSSYTWGVVIKGRDSSLIIPSITLHRFVWTHTPIKQVKAAPLISTSQDTATS